MRSFFKSIGHFINTQIEWLKSFVEEKNMPSKASSKRLISLAVSAAFLYSYVKVALSTNKIEDIPVNWMFMIAGIIGLNVLDWYLKRNSSETKEPPPGHPTGG